MVSGLGVSALNRDRGVAHYAELNRLISMAPPLMFYKSIQFLQVIFRHIPPGPFTDHSYCGN